MDIDTFRRKVGPGVLSYFSITEEGKANKPLMFIPEWQFRTLIIRACSDDPNFANTLKEDLDQFFEDQ